MDALNTPNTLRVLKGAPIAAQIRERVAEAVRSFRAEGMEPRLAVVNTTDDPAVANYMASKVKAADALGIALDLVDLRDAPTQQSLESVLQGLALAPTVHGILLEFPLAVGLDGEKALARIPPLKDVDGLTFTNMGAVASGFEDAAIVATTPLACIRLAESATSLSGKRVGVVGRGRTVGRPLVGLLLNRDATPVVCHTRTSDLGAVLRECDILLVAAGKPRLIGASHLRSGQVVIDAGINFVDGALVGDVDSEAASALGVAALSPVPGGVGPITSALIFENLVRAVQLQRERGFS